MGNIKKLYKNFLKNFTCFGRLCPKSRPFLSCLPTTINQKPVKNYPLKMKHHIIIKIIKGPKTSYQSSKWC